LIKAVAPVYLKFPNILKKTTMGKIPQGRYSLSLLFIIEPPQIQNLLGLELFYVAQFCHIINRFLNLFGINISSAFHFISQ